MVRKILISLAFLLLVFSLSFSEEKVKWINITVTEADKQTNVEVHLPLSLVQVAVNSVKTEEMNMGKVKLDLNDSEIDLPSILAELKNSPDGEYVKVDDQESHVVITKKAGMMLIDVTEKAGDKEKVKVRIPTALLDSIKIDENNQLDISSILSSLEAVDIGDLVTVESEGTKVRIWIE